MSTMPEQTKHLFDIASVGVVMATLASWLPSLAALMSIVWSLIRIYETKTVQRLICRLRGVTPPAAFKSTES